MKINKTIKQQPKFIILLLLLPSIIVLVITTLIFIKAYNNAEVMQLSLPLKDAHAETEKNDMKLIKAKQDDLLKINNQSVTESDFDLSKIFEETSNDHQITKDVYSELRDTYYLSLTKAMNSLNKNNITNSTPESLRKNIELKNLESLRKNNYYGQDIKKGLNHNSTVQETAKEERVPEYERLKSTDISNSQIKDDERANTGFKPYNDNEEMAKNSFE